MRRMIVLPNESTTEPDSLTFAGAGTVVIKRVAHNRVNISVDGAIVALDCSVSSPLNFRLAMADVGTAAEDAGSV